MIPNSPIFFIVCLIDLFPEECSSSLMIENKSLPQCSLCNSYFSCKSELIDHRKLHGIWT